MTQQALDQKLVTDEDKIVQEARRIDELYKKADKTPEEEKELADLDNSRKSRYQQRIDKLTRTNKELQETYEEKLKRLEEENNQLKNSRSQAPIKIEKETEVYGGKSFYTDEALTAMVRNGELSDDQAYKHQQSRIKAQLKEELLSDIKKEDQEAKDKSVREEDAKYVMKHYPHFNAKDPNFDPEDPLYKETCRIYDNGYKYNPRGLSEAIKEAKRILRITDNRIDVSDDFNLNPPSRPNETMKEKTAEQVELSNEERDAAIRLYVATGNVINPVTNRPYTEQEAIAKAKKAKFSRSNKGRG